MNQSVNIPVDNYQIHILVCAAPAQWLFVVTVYTPQTMNTIWRRITIDTEDGSLYVSFWNSSDDYAVMTKDEFEDYLQNTEMTMGGM